MTGIVIPNQAHVPLLSSSSSIHNYLLIYKATEKSLCILYTRLVFISTEFWMKLLNNFYLIQRRSSTVIVVGIAVRWKDNSEA
jgi:hypothetical protein